MHIFVVEENLENIKKALRELNNSFNEVQLNSKEIKLLLTHTQNKFFRGKTTEDYWKIYQAFQSEREIVYMEFKYLNRPDDYTYEGTPDYYFGAELFRLSKLIDRNIFYIWEQHENIGYEVYKSGQRINSVVSDTHGPAVSVDGKSVNIPKKPCFWGERYEIGKVIDENTIIPKPIRESIKDIKKLPQQYIIFIKKDIADYKSLINRINSS